MARLLVKPNESTRTNALEIFRRMKEPDRRRLVNEVSRQYTGRVRKVARAHYENVLRTVREYIGPEGDLPSIDVSGVRTIRFVTPEGKRGQIRTPFGWSKLSDEYQDLFPESYKFWYKGRSQRKKDYVIGLYDRFLRGKLRGTVRVSRLSNKDLKRPPPSGIMRVRASITFGRIPFPFSIILRKAFVEGREVATPAPPRSKQGRRSLRAYLWPEVQRPFITRLSARMGREMHRALRKL